jgi:hypothetical protein
MLATSVLTPSLWLASARQDTDLTIGDENMPDPEVVTGRWDDKKALRFKYGSYAWAPHHQRFDLGRSDFTISAWFKDSLGVSRGPMVIKLDRDAGKFYALLVYHYNDLAAHFAMRDGEKTRWVAAKADENYQSQKWHHLAVTREKKGADSILRVFIDGEMADRSQYTGAKLDLDNRGDLHIGTWPGFRGQTRYYDITMDSVAIVRHAFEASRIRAFYAMGRPD